MAAGGRSVTTCAGSTGRAAATGTAAGGAEGSCSSCAGGGGGEDGGGAAGRVVVSRAGSASAGADGASVVRASCGAVAPMRRTTTSAAALVAPTDTITAQLAIPLRRAAEARRSETTGPGAPDPCLVAGACGGARTRRSPERCARGSSGGGASSNQVGGHGRRARNRLHARGLGRWRGLRSGRRALGVGGGNDGGVVGEERRQVQRDERRLGRVGEEPTAEAEDVRVPVARGALGARRDEAPEILVPGVRCAVPCALRRARVLELAGHLFGRRDEADLEESGLRLGRGDEVDLEEAGLLVLVRRLRRCGLRGRGAARPRRRLRRAPEHHAEVVKRHRLRIAGEIAELGLGPGGGREHAGRLARAREATVEERRPAVRDQLDLALRHRLPVARRRGRLPFGARRSRGWGGGGPAARKGDAGRLWTGAPSVRLGRKPWALRENGGRCGWLGPGPGGGRGPLSCPGDRRARRQHRVAASVAEWEPWTSHHAVGHLEGRLARRANDVHGRNENLSIQAVRATSPAPL